MHAKAAAALLSVWVLTCSGQTVATQPQFEVASIKPSDSVSTEKAMYIPGGRELILENYSLKELIQLGWSVRKFQMLGGPKWLDSDRYNVDAKPAAPFELNQLRLATNGPVPLQLMVRSLLQERFRLKLHREVQEMGVYFLTVSRKGVLKRAGEGASTSMHGGNGDLVASATNMPVLAANLGGELGVPVIDQTGLDGLYDFRLEWSPDEKPAALALDTRPSLFTALQEQLGLKLESGRGPVEILVIDNAEKPSAN